MTKKELMNALNFMLKHNIIDTFQYNELLVKAMPYLK